MERLKLRVPLGLFVYGAAGMLEPFRVTRREVVPRVLDQIARNVRADYFRTDYFRKGQTDSLPVHHSTNAHQPSPSQDFERHEQTTTVQKALLALPEDKRELLILARYEEMPYETIAALLEVDVGTVKVRIHRAVGELRKLFLKMSGEKTKCDVKKSITILRSF